MKLLRLPWIFLAVRIYIFMSHQKTKRKNKKVRCGDGLAEKDMSQSEVRCGGGLAEKDMNQSEE